MKCESWNIDIENNIEEHCQGKMQPRHDHERWLTNSINKSSLLAGIQEYAKAGRFRRAKPFDILWQGKCVEWERLNKWEQGMCASWLAVLWLCH